MTWPDGAGSGLRLDGRCRDLLTPADDAAPVPTNAVLPDLRGEVLRRLRGTDCCTHLNDALRSLAEVPVLAATLPG
jgi:hypothetical protein